MIQRVQTLYLLSLVVVGIALLFVPVAQVSFHTHQTPIYLKPLSVENIQASYGQLTAMILNIIGMLLAVISIFLYKKRMLQLKLTLVLMMIWLGITLLLSFLPMAIVPTENQLHNTNYGTLFGVFGMLGAYMSNRHIKKDIELLKSADRLR